MLASLASNGIECHVFPEDHSITAMCLYHICMFSTKHKSIVIEKHAFNFVKKKKGKNAQLGLKIERIVGVSKRKREEFLL